jgi:HEAT repeats
MPAVEDNLMLDDQKHRFLLVLSEGTDPLTWQTPAPYDAHPMVPRTQSGQANLTVILVLIGVVISSVWVWKRFSLETQEYLVDQAVPLALVGLAVGAGLFAVVRKIRRSRIRRQARTQLIEAFERATAPDKKLDLAFQLIEVNEYRLKGLEAIVPTLRELLVNALQRAVGDKQHRTRGMAASHLGVLQDMTVVPLLMKALEDDHAYVRSCAALGLGRLRALDAKERLTTVMEEDWDQTVRSRAREALERMRR